jgi:phosphatidylglycerophosphate synthase
VTPTIDSGDTMPAANAKRLPALPLIRHLSRTVTPLLARLPVTANQITTVALALGLAAAYAAAFGTWVSTVVAGVLLVGGYVLDNCDGEIARLKNQCSTFGMHYDSFVDWVVHTAFFAALGVGVAAETGEPVWLWLGLAAALGCTLNYGLSVAVVACRRAPVDTAQDGSGPAAMNSPETPQNAKEWVLFAFRELSRADFCFIVLVLALLDAAWILLPAGAIGAQVYWAALMIRRARDFRV